MKDTLFWALTWLVGCAILLALVQGCATMQTTPRCQDVVTVFLKSRADGEISAVQSLNHAVAFGLIDKESKVARSLIITDSQAILDDVGAQFDFAPANKCLANDGAELMYAKGVIRLESNLKQS